MKISANQGWRKGLALGACLLAAASASHALTAADSGWVPVWNGKSFPADSFYVYSKQYMEVAASGGRFEAQPGGIGGIIHSTAGYSLLTTKKEYSKYKIRVDYKFKEGSTGGNAGLMILMDNTAAKTVKTDTRPRSIEINCRRDGNYPWSLWAGRGYGPYMTTTIKAGTADQYVPTGGTLKTMDITADNNRVIRSANPDNQLPGGQWNHGEAWIYADSGVFYLNGQLRTSSWGWVTTKGDPKTATKSGGVAVQSEGTEIWYTNWMIMELKDDGTPVNLPQGKFAIRPRRAVQPILALDGRALQGLLGGNTGVYTPQGRLVAGAAGLAAGPYLIKREAR